MRQGSLCEYDESNVGYEAYSARLGLSESALRNGLDCLGHLLRQYSLLGYVAGYSLNQNFNPIHQLRFSNRAVHP